MALSTPPAIARTKNYYLRTNMYVAGIQCESSIFFLFVHDYISVSTISNSLGLCKLPRSESS